VSKEDWRIRVRAKTNHASLRVVAGDFYRIARGGKRLHLVSERDGSTRVVPAEIYFTLFH